MAFANNITQLCQLAAAAYVRSQGLSFITDSTAGIRAGLDATDQQRPLVVLHCAHSKTNEQDVFDGVWDCDLIAELRSNADDTTEGDHHEHAGELFALFLADPRTVADLISAAQSNFQTQLVVPIEQDFDLRERSWVSSMTFTLKGSCGKDLV